MEILNINYTNSLITVIKIKIHIYFLYGVKNVLPTHHLVQVNVLI